MPVKTFRAPTLAPSHTSAQPLALALDWDRRLTDRLAYGLSMLSIPLSGGSDRTWGLLVSELQAASADSSAGDGDFHLVSAVRGDAGGQLGVGVYTGQHEAPLLQTRLNLAVARANALGSMA